MSEILEKAAAYYNFAPLIGAAVGTVVGAAFENSAQKKIAADDEALTREVGNIGHEAVTQVSAWDKVKSIGRSSLLAAGLAFGAGNGLLWSSETVANEPPQINIVVDRAGATGFGDERAAVINDALQEAYDSEAEVSQRIFVAGNNEVQVVNSVEEVFGITPFGGAPIQEATTLASSALSQASANENNGRNSSVVVITAGKTVGSAAQLGEFGTPVHIIDVSANTSSDVQESNNQVAEETGGAVWQMPRIDSEEIALVTDEMVEDIRGEDRVVDTSHPLHLRLAALAVSGGVMGMMFANRRKEPTRLEYKGRK